MVVAELQKRKKKKKKKKKRRIGETDQATQQGKHTAWLHTITAGKQTHAHTHTDTYMCNSCSATHTHTDIAAIDLTST
jgi:hypothetical protein